MIFITRRNLKTMISILIFTFYIINQICIIILYQIRLVSLIFEIKYCLIEVLEQPGGRAPVHKVMALRDQRHANASKARTLFADANVAPPHGSAPITWLVNVSFMKKWTATRMLVSSKAIAIKKNPLHAHTHTTITHIKAWADFISDTVTLHKETMTMGIWQH